MQLSNRSRRNLIGWLFVLPPVLLFIMFTIIPLVMAVVFSFSKYDIINPPTFIGFGNYTRMTTDRLFIKACRNTLSYTLMYVPLGLVLALGLALFLNAGRRFTGLFRTLFYLPVLSSSVANATMWSWVFNPKMGLLNGLLGALGIAGPAWLYDTKWAMYAIVIMSLWSGYAGNMLIFVAALKGVPQQLYEAARIDGANRWQQFRFVTLPAISKATFFVSTMLIIGTFQVFDAAYLLTGGGPGNATMTVVYYIYNRAFQDLRMGYASALSIALFFVILVFSLLNLAVNPQREEGA